MYEDYSESDFISSLNRLFCETVILKYFLLSIIFLGIIWPRYTTSWNTIPKAGCLSVWSRTQKLGCLKKDLCMAAFLLILPAKGTWSVLAKPCSTCWHDTEGFGHPCGQVMESSLKFCLQTRKSWWLNNIVVFWMRFSGDSIRTVFRAVMWRLSPLFVTSVALQGNVDVASKPCRNRVLSLVPWGSFAVVNPCLGVYPGPLLSGAGSKGQS